MTAHSRRELLGQKMTSVVSQEWLSGQPQAGAAGALILGHAGAYCVSAITAHEPPILISDHRPEVGTRHAMGAAEGQGCVGRQWAVLHHSRRGWHAGFQMPRRVIPLKSIRDRWERHGYQTETRADISVGVPTGGQSFSLLTVIKRRTSQASLKSERTVANINDLRN